MNLWLRLLTVTCILLSIVAGNIWGVRTAWLRQGANISWLQTIGKYFTPSASGSGWKCVVVHHRRAGRLMGRIRILEKAECCRVQVAEET